MFEVVYQFKSVFNPIQRQSNDGVLWVLGDNY